MSLGESVTFRGLDPNSTAYGRVNKVISKIDQLTRRTARSGFKKANELKDNMTLEEKILKGNFKVEPIPGAIDDISNLDAYPTIPLSKSKMRVDQH
jgi:hypothetical protein